MADELLVEGDSCDSCAPFWRGQNKEPMKLVALNRTTERRTVPIVICPYCDGSPILDRRLPPPQDNDGPSAQDL